MKTKLKHFLLLAAISLAATACSGGMSRPISGLDVSLLPARMFSISPAPADSGEPAGQPLRMSDPKTINQTSTTNN